jgi:hypothetical protein
MILRSFITFIRTTVHASVLFVAICLLVSAHARDNVLGGDPWVRIQAVLDAGDIQVADSLFNLAAKNPGAADISNRHRREILTARLAASRGDWRTSESRLHAWMRNTSRPEGSGEIFFWLGWAGLHQGRVAEADSFLVLASSYQDEPRSQEALEYRFAALLDNSPALQDYLRGLPESPLAANLRAASLEKVPLTSRLYPEARWQLATLQLARGDSLGAGEALLRLSQGSTLPAIRAGALWAYLTELAESAELAALAGKSRSDSALAAYEALLVRHQQGVVPEFARKRGKILRETGSATGP